MKRFEIALKFYSSKALLKMAGGVDAFPPPLGSAPASNLHYTRRITPKRVTSLRARQRDSEARQNSS